MQKYSPVSVDEPNMREDSDHGTYYWCDDADAIVAELERAHHAAVSALKGELIQAQQAIQRMTLEAMAMDEKIRQLTG